MQNESEIFLPSTTTGGRRVRRTRRSAPLLSPTIYRIFEQSPVYGCLIFLLFIYAVYVGILTTFDQHQEESERVLFYIELGIFLYSCVEFLLRLYGSESKQRYRGFQGKSRFLWERYLLIDLLLIICYGTVFLLFWRGYFLQQSILLFHALRFLQVLRFISLDRHVRSIPLISRSLWDYRRVLLATNFLCFLLLLPTSYLLWIVERSIETDGKFFFKTYTDSLWYTINSMATIGYGDTWPQTLLGRTLTATLCCAGVVLWTLPAGIISASLTTMDEKHREHQNLRHPAAKMILAWWRLQALNQRDAQLVFGKDLENHQCKKFVARLRFNQSVREYRRLRYGSVNENQHQFKRDLQRILERLHMIDHKLNGNIDVHHE